jgi:hypothetical protein
MTSMASQWPLIFLVGSYDSDLFILDTHDVPIQAGGQRTALMKIFVSACSQAAAECCSWLWKILESSKLDGPQSLTMMIRYILPCISRTCMLRRLVIQNLIRTT